MSNPARRNVILSPPFQVESTDSLTVSGILNRRVGGKSCTATPRRLTHRQSRPAVICTPQQGGSLRASGNARSLFLVKQDHAQTAEDQRGAHAEINPVVQHIGQHSLEPRLAEHNREQDHGGRQAGEERPERFLAGVGLHPQQKFRHFHFRIVATGSLAASGYVDRRVGGKSCVLFTSAKPRSKSKSNATSCTALQRFAAARYSVGFARRYGQRKPLSTLRLRRAAPYAQRPIKSLASIRLPINQCLSSSIRFSRGELCR